MSEGYLWGEAEVTYPDWVGTAQLDEKMTTPTIRDVIDLDQDEWMIVGLDIGGGEHAHTLRVMGVRNELAHRRTWAELAADNGGEIPVKEFLIHDVDPYDILKAITHMFDLRLRMNGLKQFPIRVVEQGDIPEQP